MILFVAFVSYNAFLWMPTDTDIDKALADGFYSFIKKPIEPDELLGTIDRIIPSN